MRKILLVAWREFRHTALTKAFILAAVLAPLAIVGLMTFMPALMKTRLAPLTGTLAVVETSGRLGDLIANELTPARIAERNRESMKNITDAASVKRSQRQIFDAQEPQIHVRVENHGSESDLNSLKDRVRSGDLVALVVIPPATLTDAVDSTSNSFDLFVASDASPHHTEMFQDAVAESVLQARVSSAGMDLKEARALVRQPDVIIKRLGEGGSEARDSAAIKMMIPIAFMMLLWISTFTSGNYLLTSTIEEKSNKVMEVLLSAVSPFQLMAGKILGQAAVSFIILAMYSGVGLTVMALAALMDYIPAILLVYLVVYFFMAFFMIASIMAGVGSAVSELRDAQSLITPAMLVLMVPLLLWFPISNDPNGVLATISSFIPPLIPFVMILRVTTATEPVPFWQIIATLTSGFAWTIVMVWFCSKIFRVGVLMYGKPPTPLELIKWVRYR